jgi:hypothetical protein
MIINVWKWTYHLSKVKKFEELLQVIQCQMRLLHNILALSTNTQAPPMVGTRWDWLQQTGVTLPRCKIRSWWISLMRIRSSTEARRMLPASLENQSPRAEARFSRSVVLTKFESNEGVVRPRTTKFYQSQDICLPCCRYNLFYHPIHCYLSTLMHITTISLDEL